MQSWVGTCITTGCAIGATGLVLFHYIRKENQNNAYMLTKEEWAQGVVSGFNNRLSLAAQKNKKPSKYFVTSDEFYWDARKSNIVQKYKGQEIEQFFEQLDSEIFRDICISALADLYRDKDRMDKLLKDDVSVLKERVAGGAEEFTLRYCLDSEFDPVKTAKELV